MIAPPILRILCVLALAIAPLSAAESESTSNDPAERERLTRLQIFLDDANFGPGKIDGQWGEFTRKALARYLRSQDNDAPEFTDQAPEDFGVEIESVDPVFTTYTVEQEDLDSLGSVPSEPEDQAERDSLPYETLTELIAEKFHADRDYLAELNEGTAIDAAKSGDTIKVPNVAHPFDLAAVRELAEKERAERDESEQSDDESSEESADASPTPDAKAQSIVINASEKMLDLFEGERLVASYPITPGSDALPAPVGEWKIVGIAHLPWFRYDKKMLEEGERSDDAHNIPPGPNNAVGIVWMALDKKGIGIHGTSAPDTIGRSASHGCIRLANWDALALSTAVSPKTPVRIEE